MAWDFETGPDFLEERGWIDGLVRHKAEPLAHLGLRRADVNAPKHRAITKPLLDNAIVSASSMTDRDGEPYRRASRFIVSMKTSQRRNRYRGRGGRL